MNRQSSPASENACSTMKWVGLPATGLAIRQHFSMSVALVTGLYVRRRRQKTAVSPIKLARNERTDYSDG